MLGPSLLCSGPNYIVYGLQNNIGSAYTSVDDRFINHKSVKFLTNEQKLTVLQYKNLSNLHNKGKTQQDSKPVALAHLKMICVLLPLPPAQSMLALLKLGASSEPAAT